MAKIRPGTCSTRTERFDIGLPSPAADLDEKISLDHELIRVPPAAYFRRAAINSRREAIKKGALLVVGMSATSVDGSIGCASA